MTVFGGNRLYLGCQNGSLHVYTLTSEDGKTSATLDKVIKSFTKKSIEQLGVIKETNSLVALSDGIVYLNDLHTYERHHVLGASSQTKGQASVFALDTSIQTSGPSLVGEKEREKSRPTKSPTKSKTGKIAKVPIEQDQAGVPTVVTTLAVACRRRMVMFGWRDGQWQEPRDVSLPHQVRSIAFPLPHTLFLGFSTLEYGIIKLPSLANSSSGAASLGELFKADFNTPPPIAIATTSSGDAGNSAQSGTTLGAIPGLGALGGLASKTGGYIGFGGIGKVERNAVVKTKSGEVMILKDDMGVMLDTSGKPSRSNSIEYALRPEESVTCWPYLVSLLPAPASLGTLSKQQAQDPLTALPSIHIHSLAQLTPVQAIRIPTPHPSTAASRPASIIDVPPPPVTQAARLLATSSNGKAPLAVITHPLQETATSKYQVHLLTLRSWTAQVDALIGSGQYEEAQSLLSSLDAPELVVPDAVERMKKLRALAGLTTFLDKRKYEAAIDLFIDENINPAKVVALFPKAISGKLFLPREEIEEVWGGRSVDKLRAQEQEAQQASTPRRGIHRSRNVSSETVTENTGNADSTLGTESEDTANATGTSPAPSSKWGFSPAKRKSGEGKEKDDDTASIRSVLSKRSQLLPSFTGRDLSPAASTTQVINRESSDDQSHRLSVDVLMRYLPDRRQHILRALAALPLRDRPTPSSPQPTSLSNAPEDLFKLPDAALSTYTPDQLQRTAQVVETALFKCYLHAKPGLLGPLCRIENWCEVEEVEELLLEAKKYRELLDLYNGKAMHQKALRLLQRMADDPTNKPVEDQVEPTVAYLHKLGAQYLDLIFEGARWVFSLNQDAGLKVFTADLEEVESLPRHAVLSYLSRTTTAENTAKYLEHVIHHLHEDGPEFHERLIELYLDEVERVRPEDADQSAYSRLTDFMETSTQYRADRLLGRIPDDKMFEVRAILLGRLGQHDGALHIYVYRLGNHAQAEEYCKRIYNNKSDPARSGIFLMLLKVFLRPRQQAGQPPIKQEPLLKPAIALLSTQGTRMDANAALELLPSLISIRELQTFLHKTVRKTVQVRNAKKVESKIRTARRDQVERELVDLEGRRVKITDGRLCPQCHKRLGNSVIAIHNPNGEVTHYQCRERWQEAKMQSR